MEEVCKLGHKNLRKFFRGSRTFPGRNLVTSSLKVKPDNFMGNYFEYLLVCLIVLDFFYCARNLDKYLSNFKLIFEF